MKKLLSLLLAVSLLLTFAACDDEEEAPDRGTDPFNYFIDYQSESGWKYFSSTVKNYSSDYKYLKVTTFDSPANSNGTYRDVSKITVKQDGSDDKIFTYNSDGLLTEYKIDRNTTKFTFSDDSSFEFTGGTGSYNDDNMLAALNYTSGDVTEENVYTYNDDSRLTKQTVSTTDAGYTDEDIYSISYEDDYVKEFTWNRNDNDLEKRTFSFDRETKEPVSCSIKTYTDAGREDSSAKIEYEYGDDGYVSKASLTGTDLSGTDLDQTEEYTWSENGFLDKVVYKDKKAGTTITYDYEYSKGVLLSIKKDGSDYKTYEITER